MPKKPSAPVVGRVIEKRLADELGDRISLVIDALDGRVHHVMLADAAGTEHVNLGTIVEVVRSLAQRPADRTIAELRAARRNIGRAFTEILPRRRADPFPVEITMATSALMSPLGSTPPGRDC
jgi:hypothetical protein